MPKFKGMLLHSTWFVAALAAYGLGSLRNNSSDLAENSNPSAGNRSRPGSSATAGNGSAIPHKRSRLLRPSSDRTSSPLADLFGSKSSSSGLEALAFQALRDPNQVTRRLAYSKLLEAMTAENAAQIRAQLVDLGAEPDQWRDFSYSWGALAGRDAFDAASKTKEIDLNDTMTGWAAANPKEAMAALDNLPPELKNQRDELTRSVVAGLADINRSLAADMVLRLSEQGNKQAPGLMEIVAKETLRADGAVAASKWSDTLPEGPLKGAAMNQIADEFSRRDLAAAALWAQSHAAKDYAARAIERIGGQWATQNPKEAVGWLESLPTGAGQSAGMVSAFNDWEDQDPVAASNYLLSMSSSPLRDSSISGFADGYAWQNPELAIQWANSINDTQIRDRTVTRAGQIYMHKNPTDAKIWLESSGLAPEMQQQIQRGFQR
jgi:hypothetical protein